MYLYCYAKVIVLHEVHVQVLHVVHVQVFIQYAQEGQIQYLTHMDTTSNYFNI